MRLPVTKQQMDFLNSIGIEDRDYLPDEIEEEVLDVVAHHLVGHGFLDAGCNQTNDIGDMCEKIIDVLTGMIP